MVEEVAKIVLHLVQLDAVWYGSHCAALGPVPLMEYGVLVVWQRRDRMNYVPREARPSAGLRLAQFLTPELPGGCSFLVLCTAALGEESEGDGKVTMRSPYDVPDFGGISGILGGDQASLWADVTL